MKYLGLTLLFIASLKPYTQAQEFACVVPAACDMMQPRLNDFAPYGRHNNNAKTVMVIGFSTMAAGGVLFLGGVAVLFSYQNPHPTSATSNNNNGNLVGGLCIAGGIAFVAGTVTMIAGAAALHNGKRHKYNKYAIISPKRNQLGFAYNF